MSRVATVGFLIAAAACAGDKKESTTPDKVKPADPQALKDADAPGSAAPGNAPRARPGGAPGTDSTGLPPLDDVSPPRGAADQLGPVVTMPSYDPEPSLAKAQVEQHLQVARTALAMQPPDADNALREARLALQVDAASIDAAAMVAFGYYHKKLYDTAELVLDDLFKRDAAKQNASIYYVYGLIYDHTNRPEQAVVSFKKAVELNPNHASALVNLGVHQLQNSQYAEAVTAFERLTKEFARSDAVTLTSLGSAYRGRSADYPAGSPDRDSNVRRAEAAYKRALKTTPSYGPAYYNLGLLYLDNDPFPGLSDTLLRLNTSKGYFDQYKDMPNVDMKLYDDRMKDVTKAIKRAEKQQKKPKAAPTPTTPAPKAKAGAKRSSNP